MAQDISKTLVVLSQIKVAIEAGISKTRAVALALESPIVTGFFPDKLVKNVIDTVAEGHYLSVALSKLDILSEYDQALIQASEDQGDIATTLNAIIDQHVFLRSRLI